jgi:hypothetical protein
MAPPTLSLPRLLRRCLAALGALGVLLTAGGAHALAASGRPASGAPLAPLDLLLGDHLCAYTDLSGAAPTTTTVRWTTRATMGGAYYEMRLSGEAPAFEGRWVFARDSVDQRFTTFYWDSFGNTGTASSPGWTEERLHFEGPYTTPQGRADSSDTFRVTGPDTFTDDAFIRFPGQEWQQLSHIECRRR